MTTTDVLQFKRRLADRTGLDIGLLKQPAFDNFVRRRSSELGLADMAAYHELVSRDPQELERLVQEVSVAETWFFRYPASFQLLVKHAASCLRKQQDEFRMLSIACASGEEPYSMAMAAAAAGWPLERIHVDAVDRNAASLSTARQACYRRNSFRELIPAWAEKWFRIEQDGTSVDARIAATVRFSRQDILEESFPVSPVLYDVVCCRNLFIYLGVKSRTKLTRYLSQVVSPTGILLVGHAEYSILPTESFEAVGARQAFALRPKQAKSILTASPGPRPKSDSTAMVSHRPENVTFPGHQSASQSPTDSAEEAVATIEDARRMANAGQLESAIAVLERLLTTQPTCSDVFELLGSIQMSLGRLDQAHDAFNKVLYLQPNNETALLQVASICHRLGDAEQARRYRRRAARVHNEETKLSEQDSHE